MNKYPKISIITPSYNQGGYIEQTIISVLEQNYPNQEYIIIDGGSTDNTVDVIKKYEKYITYWISEPDLGQSHAINKGLALAKGEVFNWVNSDDMLAPGALELVGNHFKDISLDVLCSSTKLFNKKGTIRINSFTQIDKPLFELLNVTGLNQLGMYWRLELIKQLNGVSAAFTYSMDLDLWKRYLITYGKEKVKSDPRITGLFRLHEDSKTGDDFNKNLSFFERENNAALIQYAAVAGEKYVRGIGILFSKIDEKLAVKPPVSELPVVNIKKWLTSLFFCNAQKAFFKEDYKLAYSLLQCLDSDLLSSEELKNYRSYKRWSFVKRYI